MTRKVKKVLVYGYGNPGRLDDGLGPVFAEKIKELQLEGVTADSNYQLVVEDSAEIAKHDVVIFVDADTECPEHFHFKRVIPKQHMSFSSHSISADALMAMAEDLMGSKAEAFMLGIRGYEFNEYEERLSEDATRNLNEALLFIKEALTDYDFEKYLNRYSTKKAGNDYCAPHSVHIERG